MLVSAVKSISPCDFVKTGATLIKQLRYSFHADQHKAGAISQSDTERS